MDVNVFLVCLLPGSGLGLGLRLGTEAGASRVEASSRSEARERREGEQKMVVFFLFFCHAVRPKDQFADKQQPPTHSPNVSFIHSPHSIPLIISFLNCPEMNPHRADKNTDELGETKKCPSQLPPASDGKSPRVLIAGAGLGGVFLAILLDRAGIPYEIFEQMTEIKSLDSVMGLNSNILPVYEQLGLERELDALTLPNTSFQIMYGSMKKVATLDTRNQRDL